jgi:homeobox protein MSX
MPGRLPRIPFTPHQLNELETAYKNATYLSTEEANELAKKLELTGIRVKIWFQNRRARDRRERKDQQQLHKSNEFRIETSLCHANDIEDEEIIVS